MINKFRKGAANSVSFIITIAVAVFSTILIVAWFSLNTTQVLVATENISAGQRIEPTLYEYGKIKQVEINKSFFTGNGFSESEAVKQIDDIMYNYVQTDLHAGQILYYEDLANEYNIRNHPLLTSMKHEAFTLTPGDFSMGNVTSLLAKGDRINIYALYTFDLGPLKEIKQYEFVNGSYDYNTNSSINSSGFTAADYEGVRVDELPSWLQSMCERDQMKKTDFVFADEISIAQLMYQNVPIIDITKSQGSNAATAIISNFTIAVDSKTAEELYILLSEASLGLTLLPYGEYEYKTMENTGTTNFSINMFNHAWDIQTDTQ